MSLARRLGLLEEVLHRRLNPRDRGEAVRVHGLDRLLVRVGPSFLQVLARVWLRPPMPKSLFSGPHPCRLGPRFCGPDDRRSDNTEQISGTARLGRRVDVQITALAAAARLAATTICEYSERRAVQYEIDRRAAVVTKSPSPTRSVRTAPGGGAGGKGKTSKDKGKGKSKGGKGKKGKK